MKLVRDTRGQLRSAPNTALFKVSPQMNKVDIKNYLEQIYKIPVVNVMTFNKLGHISIAAPSSKNAAPPMPDHIRKGQRLNKEEDDKIAQVFFPKDYVFEWPEVTLDPEDKGVSKEVKAKEGVDRAMKENMQSKSKVDKLNRRGAHHFFGL